MVHPSKSHLLTGKRGEEIAEKYLLDRGYEILGRNVKTEGGEIDLIARLSDDIIFVEVKTRAKGDGFNPSMRVDRAKIERLKSAAECWLGEQEEEWGARVDVIGVCEGKIVEHFEDVTG